MILPPVSRVRQQFPSRGGGETSVERSSSPKARVVAKSVCDESFGAAARVIKSDNRTTVLAGQAAGYEVIVKTLALDRLKDRVRAAARISRLWRQARGARRVGRAGMDVAPVLAIVRGINSSGHRVEALVMERIEGPTLLRVAAERNLPPREMRDLLDRVGLGVGRLARAGLLNRDHKPSNLIVSRDGDDASACPVLIDTADIRRSSCRRAIVEMLAKLLIEPIGTGVMIPAQQQVRVARRALKESGSGMVLRELLEAVRETIDAHGDPRPKDDPLGFDD